MRVTDRLSRDLCLGMSLKVVLLSLVHLVVDHADIETPSVDW